MIRRLLDRVWHRLFGCDGFWGRWHATADGFGHTCNVCGCLERWVVADAAERRDVQRFAERQFRMR